MLGRLKRPAAAETAVAAPEIQLDEVTGLPTRAHLRGWVERAIRRSQPESSRTIVAFVSIGLVRDLNDTHGPDAGDLLLHGVGDRLTRIDVPGTKVVRYAGAEFALVFEKINNVHALEEIARFLTEFLSAPFDLHGDHVVTRPAVGAAISADTYEDVGDLIADAHRSMTVARDEGRAFELHDESKRGRYETRLDESRLHKALNDHEFVLQYQPIARLDTGDTVGFEALIRWRAPGATNVGVLMPHDFMPLLEKSGLAVDVGAWVLDEACRQAAEWRAALAAHGPMLMVCNVGARQLGSTEFFGQVTAALDRHGVPPEQLCLDITESALRFTGHEAWPVLRRLSDLGVKLGLDDFGTGMSSLQYLLEFSLRYIRVDRTFVRQLGVSDVAPAIIHHIAGLGQELQLITIAEGVETLEEATMLRDLGVQLGQGYHFGKPAPAGAIRRDLDPDVEDHTWDTEQVLDQG